MFKPDRSFVVLLFVLISILPSVVFGNTEKLYTVALPESVDSPWYFHTERGYQQVELEGGRRLFSECELSGLNHNCRARVYAFTKSEIMHFVDLARSQIEAKIDARQYSMAIGGMVAVWAGRSAVVGFGAPEAVLSKIFALGSATLSSASAIYVAWEGLQLEDLIRRTRALNELLFEEEIYVTRCGHPRANFVFRLRKLGVHLLFPEQGGRYISVQTYRGLKKQEDALIAETAAYREQNRSSWQTAMHEVYEPRCGQLPRTTFFLPMQLGQAWQRLQGERALLD